MSDLAYWIWLQQALGYGSSRTEQLLSAFEGSPRRVYEADWSGLQSKGMLTHKQLEGLRGYSLAQAEQVIKDCAEIGCRALTPDMEEYPTSLRQVYGRPLVLYVLGDLGCLEGRLAIGMVGTRRCSEYGRRVADLLSRELAACGAVVVSGMAAGIDTVAHTGALKGGGKTVAVLGCGVDIAYPTQNDTLKELIAQNGAVVSEFPPKTQPNSPNFPIRNRIISGLSQGVVVVEGRRRSGSLITAGHALAQNRDVFAVPGSVFETGSVGPHWLIAQGAIPVTCTRDILEEYLTVYPDTIDTKTVEELAMPRAARPAQDPAPMPEKTAPKPPKQEQPVAVAEAQKPPAPLFLSDMQRRVYDLVEAEPQSVDLLTQRSGEPVHKVLSALTQLEVYGLVDALPGHNYVFSKAK